MKPILAAVAIILLSAGVCLGQVPTPPGDGVGLGNSHLSSNSATDSPISMSANVNAMITDTGGSVTGDRKNPALPGTPGADTASRMNSRGTGAMSSSADATYNRRVGYGGTGKNGAQDGQQSGASQSQQAQPAQNK